MSSSEIKVDKKDMSVVDIERFNYNWEIKNFSFLDKQPGECVRSPIFRFGSKNTIDWSLYLYPNGNNKENENYLSLFLNWQHSSVIKGSCKLSLINNKKETLVSQIVELAEKEINKPGRGCLRFIERNKVVNNKTLELFNNGYIIIQCEIVLSSDKLSSVIENKKRKLEVNLGPISWLKKLFLEERLSDLKINVPCGKSLPAHRSVLAACSPVFEAMLTHDMLEQRLGEVNIDDGEYKVIKEMLRFIYLGEVEGMKSIVIELVRIAHKYQIDGLIKLCEHTLMDQISVDNVLRMIILADSYNMERLKTRAIDFGSLHLKEIIKSNDFKSSEYPQAKQSIFEKFSEQ